MQKPAALYRQIMDDIIGKVRSGCWQEGDKIASQNQLSQHYDVSLITVKRALSELISAGVLFSRVGKGTYVASGNDRGSVMQQTVGVVLRDLKNPFFSLVLEGVEAWDTASAWV